LGKAGTPIWNISYHKFLARTRHYLKQVGVEDPDTYGSHAFRRGCCDDMRAQKSSLTDILTAGGWKSSAFKVYLNQSQAENDAVMAIIGEYSSDEEPAPKFPKSKHKAKAKKPSGNKATKPVPSRGTARSASPVGAPQAQRPRPASCGPIVFRVQYKWL
jgi:hypothetical protein